MQGESKYRGREKPCSRLILKCSSGREESEYGRDLVGLVRLQFLMRNPLHLLLFLLAMPFHDMSQFFFVKLRDLLDQQRLQFRT